VSPLGEIVEKVFLEYADLTNYTVEHGFLNDFLHEIRVIRVQKKI